MSTDVVRSHEYRTRLSAVRAAQRDAESHGRYGDLEALRLAEGVLESLITDETGEHVPEQASNDK